MRIKAFFKQGLLCLAMLTANNLVQGQGNYWQQQAIYEMDVEMDVGTHRFTGKQKLTYFNNSPDTLDKVYYHLYFNAFQPGSMMDTRSINIVDPDSRVRDRISLLKPNEIGYQHILGLTQDGKAVTHTTAGTILEVELAKPILPGKKTVLSMNFEGQVPAQIRRSGRNNKEGIDYSMSQWYPKLSEYDYQGWHANPYIGREFHGVWSDFDVKLTIDKTYVVAATGLLQNPEQIGHGYQKSGQKVKNTKGKKLTWHFKANNVHDFVWAADPDYTHTTAQVPNGPILHFFYQKNAKTETNWKKLPEYTAKAFQYISKNFGQYPYPTYSVIQGGDGGMEYPMATLITGEREFRSLLGVTVHEVLHSWYQGVLATNESLYPWMDEGFTSYATAATMQHLLGGSGNPYSNTYGSYADLATSGKNEPLTTHADHYKTNWAYRTNAYGKGAILVHQLGYVIGHEVMMKGMRRYFNTWKFKHPTPNDFKRVMEKESGIELDWYFEHFAGTTNNIDYAIRSAVTTDDKTFVSLERLGAMMMPLDIEVTYQDGSKALYYIPLRIMRGEKANESSFDRVVAEDWPWVYPQYTLEINNSGKQVKSIQIDTSGRLADVDLSNNFLSISNLKAFQDSTR